jgi:hypothetical protein
LSEVHHPALDPLAQARFVEELQGDIFIGRRQLDADRASSARFEQLDLDCADPSTDLEHGHSFDTL